MRKYNKFFISELENDIVVAPSEKQKTDINYRYYIICQQHLANEKTVATPKPESIETILKLIRERHH